MPRERITWFEARDFCELRGARLPTEAEWEYAARGLDALVYPWGDEFIADNAVYNGNSDDHTWAVGSKPDGVSWVGALDMAGNVWEWVSTIYNQEQFPYPYSGEDGRESSGDANSLRVTRGGSWGYGDYGVRAAFRDWLGPAFGVSSIGFRCARSQPQELTEEQALQLAEQGVSSNGEWVPYIKEIDGVEMVLVPAGCFMMGSDNGDSDEQPIHEICFDEPFWIDRYEVTNAQFAAFGGQAANPSYWTDDNLPREQITWFEARDFCELRGAQLPTEAEWEYAARGPDGLVYPWGDDFDGTLLNFCDTNCSFDWADKTIDDGYVNTAPVGGYELGASWVGALDISGNVWEWTSSLYEGYPYKSDDGRENVSDNTNTLVLRGGSWYNHGNNTRAADRSNILPNLVSDFVGFRCVRSY